MNGSEYQKEAMRTLCDQQAAMDKLTGGPAGMDKSHRMQLLHAMIGIQGEAGEAARLVQRWLWYGKNMEVDELGAELGDLLWYVAEACAALGLDMGTLMRQNLAKLRARYPERWSAEQADHANRDEGAERLAAAERPRALREEEGPCVGPRPYDGAPTTGHEVTFGGTLIPTRRRTLLPRTAPPSHEPTPDPAKKFAGHGPFGALGCDTGDHVWADLGNGARGCKECGRVEPQIGQE